MKVQAVQRTNIQTTLDRKNQKDESFAKLLDAAFKKKEKGH